MTLKKIALGFAVTPLLPGVLWAISLWHDQGSPGIAALGETVLNVLPDAYLTMLLLGLTGHALTLSALPWAFITIVADEFSNWLGSLLVPAVFGAVAGLIFWAVTRTRPVPFQGRFG